MPPTRSIPSPARVLGLGLAAWVVYVAARGAVQKLLPVSDMASYLEQDAFVTLLRLSLLAFCYWLGRLRYSNDVFQNHPGRPGLAWGLGLWLVAAFTLSWFARSYAPFTLWNGGARLVEVAIALVVAANEEVSWRGTLFESARELLGPAGAVALTTLGFTLMHVGYQPWQVWPRIVFTGLVFGVGRLRGLSLGALIAIHFAIDASSALYQAEGQLSSWTLETISAVAVAVAAVGVFLVKPKAENA